MRGAGVYCQRRFVIAQEIDPEWVARRSPACKVRMRVFSPGQLLQQPPYLSDEHPKHLQHIFDPFFEDIARLFGDDVMAGPTE